MDTRLYETENVFAAADDLAAASFLPRTSITATSRTATSDLHVAVAGGGAGADKQMRAVLIGAFGGPEVLCVERVPGPPSGWGTP